MEYTQQDIDAILKKLAAQGYEGLSKEEKQALFQKQLQQAGSNRYDSKLELFLSFVFLALLVLHGIQRIVLANQLVISMKLGSTTHPGTMNTVLNSIIGGFLVLFFGFLFILHLSDYRNGKVYFVRQHNDNKGRWKYLGKILFIVLFILLLTEKIISCWPAFVARIF